MRRVAGRSGLSLLEVIFAMAIFLMALVAITQLVGIASTAAFEARHRSQAILHCRSIMSEVRIGSITLSSTGESTLEDDPDYEWSLEAEPSPDANLANMYQVTVRVYRKRPNGSLIEAVLSEFVMDPKFVGSGLDTSPAPLPASAEDSGTDPAGGTTGGGTAGTAGTTGGTTTGGSKGSTPGTGSSKGGSSK